MNEVAVLSLTLVPRLSPKSDSQFSVLSLVSKWAQGTAYQSWPYASPKFELLGERPLGNLCLDLDGTAEA